ncbi:hypothetical protein SAMN05216323_101846 [Williamwhitmania taraxaci]|uniref:Uncharacterized protein n=1 Tax=Williamwhitmania taraxaci TaxID=1640674 RepID=A0A1G6J656_9BACT|nr:hypothetical protein SAMN05216323_101846 [Williamwhitmania taraxaci]
MNGRTSRYLTILANVIESKDSCIVKLDFHAMKFDILVEATFIVGFLVCFIVFGNPLFIIIPVVLLLEDIRITMLYYFKIKHSVNKKLGDK